MRQGLYMGSTVPYGYKRSKNNNCKFEVDKYSSRIVKRIFKMRLEGMTPTMIARKLSDEKIDPPSIYSGKNIKKTYTTYLWGAFYNKSNTPKSNIYRKSCAKEI